jgi:hypothetical protein
MQNETGNEATNPSSSQAISSVIEIWDEYKPMSTLQDSGNKERIFVYSLVIMKISSLVISQMGNIFEIPLKISQVLKVKENDC